MVAARMAGVRQGERTDLVEISTRLSQPQAAALVNVSRESVILGRKVLLHEVEERTADLLYELTCVKKMDYQVAWETVTQEWASHPSEDRPPPRSSADSRPRKKKPPPATSG